jgi:hypothetical protein
MAAQLSLYDALAQLQAKWNEERISFIYSLARYCMGPATFETHLSLHAETTEGQDEDMHRLFMLLQSREVDDKLHRTPYESLTDQPELDLVLQIAYDYGFNTMFAWVDLDAPLRKIWSYAGWLARDDEPSAHKQMDMLDEVSTHWRNLRHKGQKIWIPFKDAPVGLMNADEVRVKLKGRRDHGNGRLLKVLQVEITDRDGETHVRTPKLRKDGSVMFHWQNQAVTLSKDQWQKLK